jgi:phage major head subunit gpT-like protein
MITPANLSIFFTVAEATLDSVYLETDASFPDVWKEFANEKPFASLNFEDGWIEMLAKPREWRGSRVVHEPAPHTYTVTSRPWEHTVSVDRFMSDADLYGLLDSTIPFQARQARRLPNYWTRDLLEAIGDFASVGGNVTGNPQVGLDGLTFFNTSHPQNLYNPASTTTYSNDFTGGGANVPGGAPGGSGNNILVGGTFSPTSFMTLCEYMMQFKGEDGEVLGVMPSIAMFPAALMGEAELVLKSASFAPPAWATITGQVGAADNPIRRYGVTPVINRYLNNGQKWYLADTTRSQRGIRWGVHQSPVIAMRIAEQDPEVFNNHRYLIGYWGHAVPFWGFPWLMVRSGP